MSQYWQGRRDYRFWLEFQWQPTSHCHYLALEVTTNKCIIINHLKHKRKGGRGGRNKNHSWESYWICQGKRTWENAVTEFFLNRLCRCLHLRAYLALLCASTREHIILGAWQQPGPRHFVPRTEAIPPGTGKHFATRFLFSGSPRRPEPRAGGPICLSCRTPPRRMNLYPVSRAFTAATESAPEAPWRRRVFAKQRKIPLRTAGSDLTLPRRRAWCPAFNHPWSGARRSPRRRGCAEIAPPGLPDVTRFSPLPGK